MPAHLVLNVTGQALAGLLALVAVAQAGLFAMWYSKGFAKGRTYERAEAERLRLRAIRRAEALATRKPGELLCDECFHSDDEHYVNYAAGPECRLCDSSCFEHFFVLMPECEEDAKRKRHCGRVA